MADGPGRPLASLTHWLLATTGGALGVFVLARLAPPGVWVALLYVLVVLVALRAPDPRAALWAALVGSGLVWTDALLARPPERAASEWLTNVALVLVVIWAAALLVHRYMVVSRGWIDRSLKELEDLKYALDQSAIVATTDTRGTIKYVNDKFCEISRYSRQELLGQDHRIINSAFHPKPYIRDLWRTIANGRIWKGELRNRAKDGTIYWVDTTIVPFLDEGGRPYQYMAIRYDITERKRTEDLLREQAALTRLGEMAAVVAHEVKNPLAGIRGALQVISTRMPAESRDRAVVGDILARLDSLNEMVHDLLLFARPRSPKLAPVTLGPLIEATALLLRKDPGLAGVDVTIAAGGHHAVDADPELLQIVFSNLLLNAAQAMNGEGRVTVSIDCREGRCIVRFHDTGPGMPPEVRDRVFEPFFTTKHRGTGLGLATARRVVDLHQGEIQAECPPDGGTVLTVTLPEARVPEHATPSRPSDPAPVRRIGVFSGDGESA